MRAVPPPPTVPPRRPVRPSRRGRGRAGGFSLVEIMVGVLALSTALAMAAAMNGVATRGMRSSTTLNDRNAEVDADIAKVRELAERYTWCSGKGTDGPVTSTTCLSRDPSDESYYSPAVSQDPREAGDSIGNPSMTAFEQACEDGSLNKDLIASINKLPGGTSGTPTPTGMRRTVSPILDPSDNSPTARLLLLYSPAQKNDPAPVHRSAVITPTVANWCP